MWRDDAIGKVDNLHELFFPVVEQPRASQTTLRSGGHHLRPTSFQVVQLIGIRNAPTLCPQHDLVLHVLKVMPANQAPRVAVRVEKIRTVEEESAIEDKIILDPIFILLSLLPRLEKVAATAQQIAVRSEA